VSGTHGWGGVTPHGSSHTASAVWLGLALTAPGALPPAVTCARLSQRRRREEHTLLDTDVPRLTCLATPSQVMSWRAAPGETTAGSQQQGEVWDRHAPATRGYGTPTVGADRGCVWPLCGTLGAAQRGECAAWVGQKVRDSARAGGQQLMADGRGRPRCGCGPPFVWGPHATRTGCPHASGAFTLLRLCAAGASRVGGGQTRVSTRLRQAEPQAVVAQAWARAQPGSPHG
jgi:hypothetical protein